MNRALRMMTSGASAVAVTTGLGLIMVGLIKVTFVVPQDKPEILSFAINVPIEDPPLIVVDPPERKDVTPPPARPKISTAQTDKVKQDWIDFGDKIPPIIAPDITIVPATVMFDQEPTPIVRIAPIMPTRAERSGHCEMKFDINAHGIPFNVQAIYCSQSLFARASIKSVQGWKYRPEVRNGHAINHKGISTNIIFKLKDERGDLIQE